MSSLHIIITRHKHNYLRHLHIKEVKNNTNRNNFKTLQNYILVTVF